MAEYVISTDEITVTIDSKGAQVVSVKSNQNEREYIWGRDPKYWKYCSPVLFPVVGRYSNNKFRHAGKEYAMEQHGFARTIEFELESRTENEIWFCLESNAETLEYFPFSFRLECGYKLTGNVVEVMWKVTNTGNDTMYFAIGAHPAFVPPVDNIDMTKCKLKFATDKDSMTYELLDEAGMFLDEQHELLLDADKCTQLKADRFDLGALLIQNNQTHEVSILDEQDRPFVTVNFDAPLFGVWAPNSGNVPFVCIEPWYGRCDRDTFAGELSERDWENELESGKVFDQKYTIRFQG